MINDKQLKDEIRMLTTQLGDIIKGNEGKRCYDRIEKLRSISRKVRTHHRPADIKAKRALVSKLSVKDAYPIVHAFSLFFQLVNLCEERSRLRAIKSRPNIRQSLRATLKELKDAGVSSKEVSELLNILSIEPVLTAHPTEGKRRTSMAHLIRLAADPNDAEATLEAMWQTEEVRVNRVTPLNEVDNTLFLVEHSIFDAVADFYQTFENELKSFYPKVKLDSSVLTIASWIGGDRDGHPGVTPETSLAAMAMMKAKVFEIYDQELIHLMEEVSHADASVKPKGEGSERDPFHPAETFRREFQTLKANLSKGKYKSPAPVIKILEDIQRRLLDQKAIHRGKWALG